MPTCCQSISQSFVNQAVTIIAWNGALYGSPYVEVFYDNDGDISADAMAGYIKLIGNPVTSVSVEHGGPASGIVKISSIT